MSKETWEDRFDKEFVVLSNAGTGLLRYTDADKIKQFIKTELENQKKELLEKLPNSKVFDWENNVKENIHEIQGFNDCLQQIKNILK